MASAAHLTTPADLQVDDIVTVRDVLRDADGATYRILRTGLIEVERVDDDGIAIGLRLIREVSAVTGIRSRRVIA
jgi:hypothetical protein